MPEQRHCEHCGEPYWWPKGSWQHEGCVSHVANDVVNEVAPRVEDATNDVPKSYRYRDADARRAYMRSLMKKRRGG